MNFKEIVLNEELQEELIQLVNEQDFNVYAGRDNNSQYLFKTKLFLEDENLVMVPVTEVKIVYDKESKLWFSYHTDLVSKEKLEELEELNEDEEEEDDEEYEEDDEDNKEDSSDEGGSEPQTNINSYGGNTEIIN